MTTNKKAVKRAAILQSIAMHLTRQAARTERVRDQLLREIDEMTTTKQATTQLIEDSLRKELLMTGVVTVMDLSLAKDALETTVSQINSAASRLQRLAIALDGTLDNEPTEWERTDKPYPDSE